MIFKINAVISNKIICTFTLLKKLISIFLLLQLVTNNTFAEELSKLPRLFTHYYHHSQEHHDSDDFVDYLVNHYSDNHEEDEHQEEDKDCNLPFKNCDGCCVSTHVPLIAFMPVFEEVEFVLTIASSEKYTLENEKIRSISDSSIWQPPKLA